MAPQAGYKKHLPWALHALKRPIRTRELGVVCEVPAEDPFVSAACQRGSLSKVLHSSQFGVLKTWRSNARLGRKEGYSGQSGREEWRERGWREGGRVGERAVGREKERKGDGEGERDHKQKVTLITPIIYIASRIKGLGWRPQKPSGPAEDHGAERRVVEVRGGSCVGVCE